MELNQQIMRI
ncbi:hypothetical protein M8C21_014467 [Ambrosia artemisiifolia]|uniref:Uncharacterized protein n=1 Tax=Ambrosia artemisiifolia TaxID=4212 RepID=A0AAD5D981_AMBAR|nr:hypothetical protein M8C21_014467 [Ambrosia artemisiifolia]